ncbi:sigma factor-binding protein Crl [Vibrio sp. NTOU-M3]|uniref:sigma factor-binding protein Crl n=1 Tax=unclassified Vibrio TaxID=2614977 RepID=UPI00349FB34A
MSEMTAKPTHYRLLTTLKAIGPYLREGQCNEEQYLFDCLSVCVDDKKSPEEREFWGWWLELVKTDEGFAAKYYTGQYDVSGNWQDLKIPAKIVPEINRTQEVFHQKLVDTLQEKFSLDVNLHAESAEFV